MDDSKLPEFSRKNMEKPGRTIEPIRDLSSRDIEI